MKKSTKPLISVGIPFYNCAEYIVECATELFETTYPNVEFIFFDDGSTDDSATLVKEVAAKFPHHSVTILGDGTNHGVWYARNSILSEMVGEYIAFCDADDIMKRNALEIMMSAIDDNYDVVISSYECNGKIISPKTSELNKMPLDTVHFALWNKLIRRSAIESLYIPDAISCWDDLSLLARVFAITQGRIKILDDVTYSYHLDNPKSVTSQSHQIILNEHIKCAEFLVAWFTERGLTNTFGQFLINLKFIAKIKALRGQQRNIALWKKTFPEVNDKAMQTNLPLLYRILFTLANIMPQSFVQRILNITQ